MRKDTTERAVDRALAELASMTEMELLLRLEQVCRDRYMSSAHPIIHALDEVRKKTRA